MHYKRFLRHWSVK